MYPYHVQAHLDLAKMHQGEILRELDQQHQAALQAPHRNVVLQAVNKLGLMLAGLKIRTEQRKQVQLSPKPITGSL